MKKIRILGFIAVLVMAIAYVMAPAEVQALSELPILAQLGLVGSGSSMLGMCVSVASIKEKCGANPGGTTELYVINRNDIQTLPKPAEGKVSFSDPIVPKQGKGFAKWDFAQDTGNHNFKLSGEEGSQAFEKTVGVYIPRMNEQILEIYNNLPNGKYIVIKVDSEGQQYVYGSMLRPMAPELDYKSGSKFTDKNGTEFAFKGGAGHVPYIYKGEIPVIEVVAPA